MPENAQVIITPSTLPEGACYANEQQRLNAFAEHLSGALPGAYSTVNVGSDAPEADDRTKPWARTNADGSPDGLYWYFDGSWKRKHNESPGVMKMWGGAAGDVDLIDGGTPGTITTISGPFWEIVTAMAARFPVGVGTFAASGAVAVGGTGGEDKHTLVTAELPSVLGSIKSPYLSIIARKNTASQFSLSSTNGFTDQVDTMTDLIKGGDDTPHNNLPPYYGVYFIRRTSRIYYSI